MYPSAEGPHPGDVGDCDAEPHAHAAYAPPTKNGLNSSGGTMSSYAEPGAKNVSRARVKKSASAGLYSVRAVQVTRYGVRVGVGVSGSG